MSKTTVKNSDAVTFGALEITTKLNGGFDSNTPDKHKREITLHFTGFDGVDDDTKQKLLSELASKLRIKVNQTDGELKGNAFDSASYAKWLDENDCEFTFDVAELLEPKRKEDKSPEQTLMDLFKSGKLTKEQFEAMTAQLA